jgi:hypothetical protein
MIQRIQKMRIFMMNTIRDVEDVIQQEMIL